MANASMDRVGARVCWLIGARGDSYEFDVSDDRFDKIEIAQAIVEAEGDIVRDLVEAYHPQRRRFLRTTEVESGNLIPEHIGQIEAVTVEGCDGIKRLAEPTTATNIKLWTDYPSRFGEVSGHYSIANEHIQFVGNFASVVYATYEPNYPVDAEDLGSLQIDPMWEGVLVDGAISKLAKLGIPPEQVIHFTSRYMQARSIIRQGLNSRPEIEEVQKA